MDEADLLAEFAARRSEAAFAELVRRHLPMVLGVCRRVLEDDDAAQDVAQGVFLALARKAPALQREQAWAAGCTMSRYAPPAPSGRRGHAGFAVNRRPQPCNRTPPRN